MHDPWWFEFEVRSRHQDALRRAEQERLVRLARADARTVARARPLHPRIARRMDAWLVALGYALQGRFSEAEPGTDAETAQAA